MLAKDNRAEQKANFNFKQNQDKMISFSACMASYNGAKYIEAQIRSIIDELGVHDELIIVDDKSTDETISIIKKFQDSRVRVYRNEKNLGAVQSFSKAISLAKNEIIILCDQDDIWISGRATKMIDALSNSNALVASSNSIFINQFDAPSNFHFPRLLERTSKKHLYNIASIFAGKAGYWGCTMAFKRDLNRWIIPIPAFIESHDLWIALCGNLLKRNIHIEDDTLLRRIHDSNASLRIRPLYKKIFSRAILLASIVAFCKRNLSVKTKSSST